MEAKNYRAIFKKSVIINSISDFVLPFSIELKRAVACVPSILILFVLKKYLLNFIPIFQNQTVNLVYFAAGVYYLSLLFSDEYEFMDTKNIYKFIFDYFKYFFTFRASKKIVTDNEIVQNLDSKIKFTSCKL